jgi:uncharacterized protein YndB with AHSA1/START domain/predicted enzyme related to lactoylglutathione lyase
MMSNGNATAIAALVIRRTYRAPRERVFAAWTTPDILRRWMCPAEMAIPEVEFDARVGGSYRFVMVKPDGERFVVRGVVREFRKPERVSYTWQWDGDDGMPEGNQTLVTLDFIDRGGDTELVLTQENFTDADSRSRHEAGWTSILDKLTDEVRSEAPGSRAFRITGIDLSGFMVKDTARAIAFYRDVLGLEPVMLYPENRGAEYELPDGSTFGLWGGGENTMMPFQPSNGILFAVDDLCAALSAIKARGIPVLMETETPVCFMAVVADPEGNSIVLHKRKA